MAGTVSKPKPVYLLFPPKPESDFTACFSHLTSLLISSSVAPSKNPNRISLSPLDRATIGATAGAAAGAFTYVALLPLDAVKTNLQAKLYSSSLEATVSIFKTKGIQGFYRGVSAVAIGSATSSAVYFSTCELAKHVMYACGAAGLFIVPSVIVPPLAGAMGNVVSSAIMVPKELITQRMQAGASGRSWQVLLRILKSNGVLGLYAGYTATLLRNLPAGILSYSSFEYLKAFVLYQTKQNQLKPVQSILCGALAGAISASLTTPLDVVKTRLMTQTHKNAQRKVSEILRQIVSEEGWGGLARGIGPRVLHSACFAALGYFAFETARLAISKRFIEQREKETVADLAL